MRLSLALALVCVPGVALAQSAGTLFNPATTPNTPLQGVAAINAAMAAKVDVTNGVMNNPTLNGGTLNNPAIVGPLTGISLSKAVSISTFDGVNINPNVPDTAGASTAGEQQLPTTSIGCHEVGQGYVASQQCYGMQATNQTETYMVSINLANLDNGTAVPTTVPGGNNGGPDKVGQYIGVDEASAFSTAWDQNSTMTVRAGAKGGIGYEFDIGTLNPVTTTYGVTAVGAPGTAIGILMTGVPGLSGNSNAMNGPAFVCTSDGGGNLWTDCIAGTGGVRDNLIEDFSQSDTSYNVENSHRIGFDTSRSVITGTSFRMSSGLSSSTGAGQDIQWIPGAGTTGAGTDTIGDTGGGLAIATDNAHTINLTAANVSVNTGGLFFNNFAKSLAGSPYIGADALGNIHVGTTTPGVQGGLDVDGRFQANDIGVDWGGAFTVPATQTCTTPSGPGPTGACMNFLAGTGTLGSVGLSLNVKSPGNLTNAIVGESVNVYGAAGDAAALYDYNPSVTWPAASTLGGASTEADVGNLSNEPSCGDAPGGPTCAQRFGEWLTGISFYGVPGASNGVSNPNSAALFVTGQAPNSQNNGTDNNGVVWKQWIDGIRIAGQNATRDNDIYTQTQATVGYTDNGTHSNAIVLNGNYSLDAIQYIPLIGGTYTDLFHVIGGTGGIYTAAGVNSASSQTRVKTVAGLAACNAAAEGTRAGVTDATANTFGATAVGSGSNHEPVYCNGTAWVIE